MALFKSLTKKGKKIFLVTCFLFMLQEAAYIIVTYRLGEIINFAVQGSYRILINYSINSGLILLVMYTLNVGAQAARGALLANEMVHVSDKSMKNILLRLLSTFRKKDDAYYLNFFSTDLDMYRDDYLDNFAYVFGSAVSIILSLLILSQMHPWLLIVAVIMMILPLFFNNLFARPIQKYRKRYSDASEKFTSILRETIEGYETIHTNHSGEAAYKRFHELEEKKLHEQTLYNSVYAISSQNTYSISSLMGLLGIVFCAWLVMRDELTIGALFSATMYLSDLSGKVGNGLQYLLNIRSTKLLRKKINDEMNVAIPQDSNISSQTCGLKSEEYSIIEYDQVSFSFDGRELYNQISCCFQPGNCYAIVGESGSGKSTLIKLLLKYYEDYTGTIWLAGQDIRQLSEQDIYRMVGVVNQTPYLFNASLYDNITMFSKEPTRDSESYQNLLEELNLTELATRVGEDLLGDFGDKISGGERQRINIARTFRRHPSIIIFDEPTTGLDPENISLINDFIFRHKEMTRIVITHDWSEKFLSRFDQVIPINGFARQKLKEKQQIADRLVENTERTIECSKENRRNQK